MPKTTLPFTNGFYVSDSLPLSAQECLNWYVDVPQAPARSAEVLLGTPGVEQLATSGEIQQANRGSITFKDRAYYVNGSSLYRYEDGVLTTLGTVAGSGRVSLAENGAQLVILVPGGEGYVFFDDPDTLTEITDLDFRANGDPQYVVFIDGYFVFTTDGKKFIVSALNDGLNYNALDFGSAEANPDDTVAPFVFKNQLYIAGTVTTEAFQNVGGAGFPFTRSGLYLSKGVSAPLSLVDASDSFMWIGGGKNESPAIWMLAGSTVRKVSTTPIDNVLQDVSASALEQIQAWSYAERGAYFVGFRLPTTTFVLDTITGRWHERKSLVNGELQSSRVSSVISAYGAVLVGDALDGRVGQLSKDTLTEYGVTIIRRVAGQPLVNLEDRILLPSIEATVESGVGNTASPDPQLAMDLSHDGGKTFRDLRLRPMGKIGEYRRRAIWRRNGRFSRDVVVRLTLTDPVKPVLLGLTAEVA